MSEVRAGYNKTEVGVIPVSYTHLDVYKRQRLLTQGALEILETLLP